MPSPVSLNRTLHTPDSRPLVAGFHCGEEAWASELSDYIRGKDPFYYARKRGTRTWLYSDASGAVVGYGCLGTYRCPDLFPEDPETQVQIIPNLAIHADHQRRGYATYICKDLLREAASEYGRAVEGTINLQPLVVLFVHPQNDKAIGLYKKLGFRPIGITSAGADPDVRYNGMVIKIV